MSKPNKEEDQLDEIASNFFSSIAPSNAGNNATINKNPNNAKSDYQIPLQKFDDLTILKKTRSQSRNHQKRQDLPSKNNSNLEKDSQKSSKFKPKSSQNNNDNEQWKSDQESPENSLKNLKKEDDSFEKGNLSDKSDNDSYGVSSVSSSKIKQQYKSDNEDSSFIEDRIIKKQINNNKMVNEDQEQSHQSEKGKTIAEYVTDSLAKSSKKMRSQQNSRMASKVPSRKPSQFYKEDWNDDYNMEDSQQYSNFNNMNQQQQLSLYSPAKRAQMLREQQQKNTKYTTSSSFSKRPNTMNKKWSDKETQQFYRFLAIFGTDFTTIQSYLQTKTVTQIKNKFNKEEKKNPEKINDIFKNPRKRLYKKLHKIEEFEMLKNHYDSKFDLSIPGQQQPLAIQSTSQQDLKMIKNEHLQEGQHSYSQANLDYVKKEQDGEEEEQKLDHLSIHNSQNNNNNGIKSQPDLSQSQSQQSLMAPLTKKNLGLICKAGDKEIPLMNYPKHRKDSQTSNDSVARLIEENVVAIYNKEVEMHNSSLKLMQQGGQIGGNGQQNDDSDLSTNTTSHQHNNLNIIDQKQDSTKDSNDKQLFMFQQNSSTQQKILM